MKRTYTLFLICLIVSCSKKDNNSNKPVIPNKFDFNIVASRINVGIFEDINFNYTTDYTGSINPLYYFWDFGNGKTSSDANVEGIYYKTPGVYSVKLQITLSDQSVVNKTVQITVNSNSIVKITNVEITSYPQDKNCINIGGGYYRNCEAWDYYSSLIDFKFKAYYSINSNTSNTLFYE